MSFGFLGSIVQTLIFLSILVVVHEFGHFITARMFGVKVYEFAVGFGPVIAKCVHNGVQYSFRWILMGGFCKIAGMDMAVEGTTDDSEPLKPEESFQFQKLWKRILIIAAGPLFNLFLAIILMFVTAAFIGLPSDLRAGNPPIVEQASPGFPAFEAGVLPDDRILAIDEQKITVWQDVTKYVAQSDGSPLKFTIERSGKTIVKEIVPQYLESQKRYFVGLSPVINYETVSIGEALKMSIQLPWFFMQGIVATVQMLAQGDLTAGAMMGPIGMVSVIEQNAVLHLFNNMFLAIQISMFLFFFNLLPLPFPFLDGGWIMLLLVQKLIGREFTENQLGWAQMIGMSLFLLLGIYVAYGDVLRLIKRGFGGE